MKRVLATFVGVLAVATAMIAPPGAEARSGLWWKPSVLYLMATPSASDSAVVKIATDRALADVTFAVAGSSNFPVTFDPALVSLAPNHAQAITITVGMKIAQPVAGDVTVHAVVGGKTLGPALLIHVNKVAPHTLTWHPSSLALEMSPGETITTTVTVTSVQHLIDLTLAVRMPAGALSATVAGFPSTMIAGQPVTLTVTITLSPQFSGDAAYGQITVKWVWCHSGTTWAFT